MDLNDALLQPNPSAVFAPVGEEAVLLDLDNGVYYGLNEVAMRVWQLIHEGMTLGGIRQVLLSEFEVDAAVLEQDLDRIVRELEGFRLVRRTSV